MTATAPQPARARIVGDRSQRPPESTIPEMFRRTVERNQDKTALMYKSEGEYRPITYPEYAERVRILALGLAGLGLKHGVRVALLSENRPEWAYVDLAVTGIGAVNVPLYATLPPPQVEYIVRDSESQFVIVSHAKQLAKVLEVRPNLPLVSHVIVIDPPDELPEGVLTMAQVMEAGASHAGGEAEWKRLNEAVRPDDLASIIYTSGTTGAPKGAMLTHDNFMSNALAAAPLVEIRKDDLFLSFLPLSHVFERLAGHYFPLVVGATIAYAESIFTVQSNMVEVKPTVLASVPRLYEAIESRIRDGIQKQPESRRKMAEQAIEVGWEYHSRRILGESPGMVLSTKYAMADRLVLGPLREKVTGGRLRFFISGGAPLPVRTAQFLTSLGLHILEGYGLTETSPVICVNLPSRTKLGTVGPPITGVEVMIAPDGEILSRGPHIMKGYYKMPEETAGSIDADGWFHTGDIGVLDEEGYLKITDRKKDIIVLANGKNVAPQPIEAKIKGSSYVANVVLFGDRQTQVVALVVPDMDHLKAWARNQGIDTEDVEKLLAAPQVKKLFREEIDRNTQEFADFEKVRRFTLLPRDFSQDRDELTPTLKIKRRVVAQNCAAEIQSMYGGRGEG